MSNMMRKVTLLLTTLAALSVPAAAQQPSAVSQTAIVPGSSPNDFDWEVGSWTTKVRVLRNALSGQKPDWAEYEGTSIVRPLLDGRANFVELSVAGQSGKIEGGALRLYNPQTRQWNINYASLRNGMLTAPIYGGFDTHGRGTFYGQDMMDGRAIIVRFIITRVSDKEARFEQAYSADGGA